MEPEPPITIVVNGPRFGGKVLQLYKGRLQEVQPGRYQLDNNGGHGGLTGWEGRSVYKHQLVPQVE